MKSTVTHVAVAALIFSLQGAARSADSAGPDKTSISDNEAVVEIAAPPQTRIVIDGQDKTGSREVTFGPQEKGELAQHELTARFSSGGTVSKTLLLRGGLRYHIPLRDPQAAEPELIVQTGHFGPIWSVAFSPDGKWVLTGSWDQTAILWDAATGNMLRTFSGHQESVSSVAFSPDAKSILTASSDETAIAWDARTGKKLQTFEGYRCAAFSPDGLWVVTGSYDKTATLWDRATGKRLRQFEGDPEARKERIAARARQYIPETEVRVVTFSADGRRVLTSEAGDQAILWDAETGEQLRTFKGHGELVASVAFSPDGTSILTGSWDKTAILWDAKTGEQLRTFTEHSRRAGWFFPKSYYVSSAAFSPDGKSVLTGSWDRTAVLSNISTGQTLRTFKGHDDHVTSVAFSPDGQRVLTGSREGRAILWDASNGNRLVELEGRDQVWVTSIELSADERLLLAGYRDGKAVLWDTAIGTRRNTFETQQRDVASVAFSPDGQQLLTGSIDGAILWDTVTKDKLHTFEGNVHSAAFSPDGKAVLTWHFAWGDTRPTLWDAATGAKLRAFKAEDRHETCVAFSPDGQQIFIGYYDGTVDLWDAATGNKLWTFKQDRGSVTSLAFSPDGKRALTGFGNGTVLVWDAGTTERLREFAAHQGCVAFSPDGNQVLTGSKDQSIVLWNAETGSKLRTFAGPKTGPVRCVLFSRNGRFVVSGSEDGTVRLWDIATGDELCRLIALAGDDWLAVTPEGMFDGSPGGIRKVTYRIQNELTVVPAGKLNKDFQQPGLLARLLKGERPQAPQPKK